MRVRRGRASCHRQRPILQAEGQPLGLRGQAMRTNRRISEIAEAIVTSEALMGDME